MIIGSAARTPDPKFMVGGSVNAALANYTKALAGQGLVDDVNVNLIHPGQTETDRLTGLLATRAKDEDKSIEDVMKETIPDADANDEIIIDDLQENDTDDIIRGNDEDATGNRFRRRRRAKGVIRSLFKKFLGGKYLFL